LQNVGPTPPVSDAETILDASVLIAIFKGERFEEDILEVVQGAVMSAVNYAEVWSKLRDFGLMEAPNVVIIFGLLSRIEPFTEQQARAAADMRRFGKDVSLGDRACMALAVDLKAEIYTADKAWANFDLGCPVHLIR
jgi:ribonuclease VapC